jgi:hypothetical protein
VKFAEYSHRPPASAHAGSVSTEGAPQNAFWHLPARQTAPKMPSQGQLQLGEALPTIACANAALYCAAAQWLTAAEAQLTAHEVGGHEGTSPTATQSLSTVQD